MKMFMAPVSDNWEEEMREVDVNLNPERLKVKFKLKSCPFCGGKAKVKKVPVYLTFTDKKIKSDGFVVECTECYSIGGTAWTKTEAIKAWNRRQKDD